MLAKIALRVLVVHILSGNFYLNAHSIKPEEEDPAVTNLRNYIRIKTAQPNPGAGYVEAIKFLNGLADEIGLSFDVIHLDPPNLFATCMTWNGTDPSLKSILLNSHMDVVAADEVSTTGWKYPPFEAYKDNTGRIYGRGAFDMKSTTIAELEAIRRLKQAGFEPKRTIHITVMPGEELAGLLGMRPFVQTEYFKNLNVGFDLDEGPSTNKSNLIYLTNVEKNAWKFNISATGVASHGSDLPKSTAPQLLQVVIDRLMGFRQQQYLKRLLGEPLNTTTSINLVRMGGGNSDNSIPHEVWASFDMRIWQKPHWTFADVDKMLNNILNEARLLSTSPAENVTIKFLVKSEETGRTPVDDSNPWWTVMQNTCREMNATCISQILIPASDGRFVRNLGIPTFGTNLFPNTPITAHQDNEFIDEKEFLRGIDRYVVVIKNLALVSGDITP